VGIAALAGAHELTDLNSLRFRKHQLSPFAFNAQPAFPEVAADERSITRKADIALQPRCLPELSIWCET
jgi:hypothetical protein